MPFESLRIIPGVDIEETRSDNAAGISESNFIRWRDNLPEKRGGCTRFDNANYIGKSRALHAWQSLSTEKRFALGTTERLYVSFGNNAIDITPETSEHALPINGNFFSVAGSSIITVDDPSQQDLTIYDTVVFNDYVSIGGALLYGAYDILSVNSTTKQYTIDAGYVAALTVTGSSVYQTGMSFLTTIGSAKIRCNIPNKIPSGAGTYTGNRYFSNGDVVYIRLHDAFNELTPVGDVYIDGEYTVIEADDTGFYFLASTSANSVGTGNNIRVWTTYYLTTGPNVLGLGYGKGFYKSFYQSVNIIDINSSGTVASVILAGPYTSDRFLNNETVYISGLGAPYDGTFNIYSASVFGFSYDIASPGTHITNTGTASANHKSGGYGTGIEPISNSRGTQLAATDWTLDNWGEVLLACPRNGPIFTWIPSQGYGNAGIIPQAPLINSGMFLAMPQRQIMAWGSTYTGFQDPLLIRWCDIGNYNDWTATVTNQAGGYHIPTGSLIVAGVQGPTQQYWFTDIDVYVSQYTGPPYVYGFNKVGSGCGLIGQKAVCTLHSNLYWMSQKQFFMMSGTNAAQTIPCTVWDFVFQNINLDYVDNIRAAPNSMFNEVNWFFPSMNSQNGENDAYVCFNILYNEWDYGYLSRSAWIDQSVLGGPLATQNNYDETSLTPWTSNIFQHETSYNLGSDPISASFKTGYFTLSNGNDLVFVDWLLPDMKWGEYSLAPNASLQMTFYVTDYPGEAPKQFGPYTITSSTPYIEPRFRGRYVQIEVSSNDLNSFWRLGSMRYRYAVSGRR